MLLLRLLLVVVLLGMSATAWPSSVSACVCLSPWSNVDSGWAETVDWGQYEQIFRGTVVSQYPKDVRGDQGVNWTVYEFDVSVVWKNIQLMYQDRIWVYQRWFTNCDRVFDVGEEYIVAVDFDERAIGICDVTVRVASGRDHVLSEMLDFLGEGTVAPDGSYERRLDVMTPAHLESENLGTPAAPVGSMDTPLWQWAAVAVIGVIAGAGAASAWTFVRRRRERE